jgi:CDP-glucose 4,6-dehydratase
VNPSFWKSKKVFITGHTGFKGGWLSLWLHSMGAELHGYALNPISEPSLYESARLALLFKTNTIAGASLASNQITLPAGTYFMQAYPVSFRAEGNIARIYNITDSSVVSLGINNTSGTTMTSQSPSNVSCIVTITGTKVFELQHICQTTASSIGFGIRAECGQTEVYSEILIWKVG